MAALRVFLLAGLFVLFLLGGPEVFYNSGTRGLCSMLGMFACVVWAVWEICAGEGE